MLLLLEIIASLFVARVLYGAYTDYCKTHQKSALTVFLPIAKMFLIGAGLVFSAAVLLTHNSQTWNVLAVLVLVIIIWKALAGKFLKDFTTAFWKGVRL